MTATETQEAIKDKVKSQKHLFIAAPFFNQAEIEVVSRIEDLCDQAGLHYFSAMREPPNPLTPEKMEDPKTRSLINTMCLDALERSFAVLAWLDRIQSPMDEVMLIHRPATVSTIEGKYKEQIVAGIIKKRRMRKADDGVIFECGYATALELPIIGFTLNHREEANIMLSENLMGIAQGWVQLNSVLKAFGDMENPLGAVMHEIHTWGYE